MSKINGGFPPIKLCTSEEIKKQATKERLYSVVPKQNINVKELLKETKKKIISVDTNEDEYDKVEYIDKKNI